MIDNQQALAGMDATEKRARGISKLFGTMGKAALAAGAVIGTALMAVAAKGLADAADAQAKIAQLDAVLKSTKGAAGMTKESILELAEALEKNTKFSAENALEAQSLLLTFTKIGKDVFPRATQAAADMATAMGTDMKAQSIALGKALNDPVKGVAALTRVGVQFTDEQKNMINAMVEAGDVAGAQKVILAELETQFGGSAVAAGQTLGGQLERVNNAFGAIGEGIMTNLLPRLQKFLDWVLKKMPEIQSFFEKTFSNIGKAIDYIIDPVIKNFMKAFNFVKDNFDIIGPAMAAMLLYVVVSAFVAWATAAGVAAGATIAALAPVLLPIAAIGAAVAGMAYIWRKWGDNIKEVWGSVTSSVRGYANSIISIINGLIRGLNKIQIKVPDWVPFIGGRTLGFNVKEYSYIPSNAQSTTRAGAGSGNLATFHDGGIVPGQVGEEKIVKVLAGEEILPINKSANRAGGPMIGTLNITAQDPKVARREQERILRKMAIEWGLA